MSSPTAKKAKVVQHQHMQLQAMLFATIPLGLDANVTSSLSSTAAAW